MKIKMIGIGLALAAWISTELLASLPAAATAVERKYPVTVRFGLPAGSAHDVTFRLYYSTSTNATVLFEEGPVRRVAGPDGSISHVLGSLRRIPATVDFQQQLWVKAQVGFGRTARVRWEALRPAPYATWAENVDTWALDNRYVNVLEEGSIFTGMIVPGAVTDEKVTGPIATSKLEVGTTAGTVAAGDHAHTTVGDITAVQTAAGSGLQGGAESDAANLSLLKNCGPGELLKWNGTAWACAPDTDTNSGGTVTVITAGAGLTGGTINTSGTIAVDTAAIQARVGGTCDPGSSIRAVNADGTVVCEPDDGGGGGGGTSWLVGGNAATVAGTDYLGTSDNVPLSVRVNDTPALRLEPTTGTPNLVGGYGSNAVTAPAGGATIGGGGQFNEQNTVTDEFGTVGGGANNRAGNANATVTDAGFGTVGGGRGNIAAGLYATVGGGLNNTAPALQAVAGGGAGNSAGGSFATVSGGTYNAASGQGAAIGGGYTNAAAQPYATVAGGASNQANATRSAIGGGAENQASGTDSTIGGGWQNRAAGDYGVVAGGDQNVAGGAASAVPGGSRNVAGGSYSLAAGRQAVVRPAGAGGSGDTDGDEGTFVWSDGQGVPFTSTGANQFLVRAQGGVGINTNAPSSALDVNGTVTAAGLRLTTSPTSGYVLMSDAAGNGSWQPVAGSAGGTVTQVDTGAGLTGGPITGTGTVSVASGGIANGMIADGAVTDAKITGPIATWKLDVGTTTGTVAAGDHNHFGATWSGSGDFGLAAQTAGPQGIYGAGSFTGVWGYSPTASGITQGILGQSVSPEGRGVVGRAYSASGPAIGVVGESDSANGIGVSGTGATGVKGTSTGGGYAGHFTGNVHATGTVTAARFEGDGSSLTNVSARPQWQEITTTTHQMEPNKNYVINSSEHVTLTLPPVVSFTDTLRVTGVGTGGWTIAQNNGQAIATKSLPSAHGAYWVYRGLTGLTGKWMSVASSAAGTKLIAADYGGQLYTSADSGMNWTPRESNRNWFSVASSANGTKLIAAVYGGQLYTSIDSGVSWTPRESNRSWRAVASSADGTRLVAAEFMGRLYTSADSGTSWTPRESNRNWYSVASSADGIYLVAVVSSGQIYTSTDLGASWTPRESDRNWTSVASSADGTRLFATEEGGQIYTSTDSGVSWYPRGPMTGLRYVASSADGTRLVATDTFWLYTSTDSGVSWTRRARYKYYWNCVATSADGNKLVAAVFDEGIYFSPGTTTVGTSGSLSGGQYDSVELMSVGNSTFNILSHEDDLTVQ